MNELVQIGPISPLRQRLLDDMALRRFGLETQRNYLRDVSRFATWLQRSPHTATAEDIRQFQFERLEAREEERRVGKECVGTCRSGGWPDQEKKKEHMKIKESI